ncbi:MAG TPA: hypothetical protein VN622_10465 [Clostridia bacterium]|nr:hypothetical protein [Clostridia bacterium]
MRIVLLIIVLTILSANGSAANREQSLAEVRARADAARGEDCAKVCPDAARAMTEESNSLFNQGEVENGHAAMRDAVAYARKAAQASIESRKKQKQTEIALRKLAKRMTDIKETLSVDDRASVQEAIDQVEALRSELLAAMFDMKKDKR